MDPVNPTQPRCLSPVVCNNSSLSAILWACGIVIGVGTMLAAYDPSSLMFVDFTLCASEITACYLAGGLVTLISCIQLIRLSGGFLTCCNFNASAPDEVDKETTSALDTSHDVKLSTSTDFKIADTAASLSPLHELLLTVTSLAVQPVWDVMNETRLRPEVDALLKVWRWRSILRNAKQTDAALISDIIIKTAALFRQKPTSEQAKKTQQEGFESFFSVLLSCPYIGYLFNDYLLELLKKESEKSPEGIDAFHSGMICAMMDLMPHALSHSYSDMICLLVRYASPKTIQKLQQLAGTFPEQYKIAILAALNGRISP